MAKKITTDDKRSTYKENFASVLKKLILSSSMSEEGLFDLLIMHYKMLKPLLPWKAIHASLLLPDGSLLVKKIGKDAFAPEAIAEEKRTAFCTTVSKPSTKEKNKLVCFSVWYNEERIYSDAILLDEKASFLSQKDRNLIYQNLKLLMHEAYRVLKNQATLIQQNLLNKFSSILNSSLEPEAIQRKAIEAITNVLNSEVGSLLLLDSQTGELKFEVALGKKEQQIKQIRLKLGEGIAGWVALHGKPLLINDCKKDKRFTSLVDQRIHFDTRNMICVPVKTKDIIVGVLQAINKKNNGRFSEEDLGLLSALSEQVAIALENARLFNELQQLFMDSAVALAEAIEKRDPYTGGHIWRVVNYTLAIARYMELSEEEYFTLKLAAILHDIGKIGIDDHILRKPAPLDFSEFEIMKRHPVLGAEIIKPIKQLQSIVGGILNHHERYDGKGYPFKLKSKEIPLIARIIAVADTFDAMCSSRPYRDALSPEEGRTEILRCSGTQFDPEVVKAFGKAFDKGEISAIMKQVDSAFHRF